MSLSKSPISNRVFATSVLVILGIGFALSLLYMYSRSIKPHRQEGHGLVQGVALSYHGGQGQSILMNSLEGSMGHFLDPDEFIALEGWIGNGASEEAYQNEIQPIIDESCVDCHNNDGYWPPLETYEEVAAIASPESEMNLVKLGRMTHVHILGIPLLFYILGALFIRTRFSERLKAIVVVVPFVGVLLDISHWWFTAADPSNALGIIIGGTLMSLGFMAMWLMTIYDIWKPTNIK